MELGWNQDHTRPYCREERGHFLYNLKSGGINMVNQLEAEKRSHRKVY